MESVALEFFSDTAKGFAITQGGMATAAVLQRHLLPLLTRADVDGPGDVRAWWRMIRDCTYPYGTSGIASMARSVIDLALWDLVGHGTDVPVYGLLGGTRRSVPAYANGGDIGSHRSAGYLGSKVNLTAGPWHPAGLDEARRGIADARLQAGSDHLLMIDAWMGLTPAFAGQLAPAISDAQIHWLEEPFPPDAWRDLPRLRAQLGEVRLAAGEHVYDSESLCRLVEHGVDVLQPDIAWFGGLTPLLDGVRDIQPGNGERAVTLAPHLGGTAWGVHAAMLIPSVSVLECYLEPTRPDEAGPVLGAPKPVDGVLTATDRPGFGVLLNDDVIDRQTVWATTIDLTAGAEA
jgi:L-rhamnonate dehydratase